MKQLVPNPTWIAGFWQACCAFPPSNLPLSFLSFCPWCGSLPPLSPPLHPNRLLQARETRDSAGKG